MIDVRCKPALKVRPKARREITDRRKSGLFRDPIDHAAATSTAKDHCIRPTDRLDTVEIIQIAIVLHIVADAVTEKVSTAAITAKYHIVAIILALMGRDARHVSNDIRNAGHHLVTHLLGLGDSDRLRHVAKRCKGLSGRLDRSHQIYRAVRNGHRRLCRPNLEYYRTEIDITAAQADPADIAAKSRRGDPKFVSTV